MVYRRNALLGLVSCAVACSCSSPAVTNQSGGHLTQNDKAAIEWFDTLGFPDLSNCELVRVSTGWWSQSGNEPPQNQLILAFLLKQNGDEFTVFTLDLFTRDFKKTPADTAVHEQVGYEVIDLKVTAVERLVLLRRLKGQDRDIHRRFGETLSERAEVFALARACAAHGLNKLAHDLIEVAARMPHESPGPGPDGLKDALAEEIGHAMMWRAVLKFGDPKISRNELLAEFRRFQQKSPKSSHAKRAMETVELLEQMVREDRDHAEQSRKPLDQMTTKERVAELIFQLRDQNGQQWSQPGACEIFFDPRGEESAAAQLLTIGYGAVPQLIEAVEDKRFSRSVGYWRDFCFSHHVLRIGDCAEEIIERIAGRGFYEGTYTNGAAEDEELTTKQRIQRWWDDFQRKGEMQMLVEGTVRGDGNSPSQAERLVEKYPDVALEAIVKGVEASEGWQRTRLVETAAKIKGEAGTEFLFGQMKQAPALDTRLAAAKGLLGRARSDAIAAMIGEWTNSPDEDASEALIEFLATCGEVEAIAALEEGFEEHAVDRRLEIVSQFGYETGDQRAELREAIQRLLFKALGDTQQQQGTSGSWGGKSYSDPRICDMAGHVLWMRWPDKYEFDLAADLRQRDVQRAELINLLRREQGQKPLPLP